CTVQVLVHLDFRGRSRVGNVWTDGEIVNARSLLRRLEGGRPDGPSHIVRQRLEGHSRAGRSGQQNVGQRERGRIHRPVEGDDDGGQPGRAGKDRLGRIGRDRNDTQTIDNETGAECIIRIRGRGFSEGGIVVLVHLVAGHVNNGRPDGQVVR